MRNAQGLPPFIRFFLIACAAVIAFGILYDYAMIYWAFPAAKVVPGAPSTGVQDPWPQRGQFGDMFGALNTLFSGMALAGVVATLLMQRHDLKLQEKAMADARAASREQTDIALQTALLQALATNIEVWRGLRIEPGIDPETKTQLIKQENDMVIQLTHLRERLDARLKKTAAKSDTTVG